MAHFRTVWLLVTAAACGAAVMAVELLGARFLGAAYGGSLTVWAAIISVTLLSLAAGYFAGGYLSDRFPRPALLYGVLLAAGVMVAVCPYLRFALKACYEAFGIMGGALASAALVFSAPLVLFGMVSPFVIRLLCTGGEGVGIRAGGVYAVSTLGSVVGTLATGLWLIPSFGTSECLRGAAAATALVGAVGLALEFGVRGAATALLPAAIVALPGPAGRVGDRYAAPDGEAVEVLATRDSAYGHIAVLGKGSYKLLVVDGIVQTGFPTSRGGPARGQGLAANYFQELLPYTVPDPNGRSALVIGLAGGMTPAILSLYGIRVECVDLDPAIIETARDLFGFDGPAVADDGRKYLESCGRRYDFCVIDTYSGDVFPFHLATVEAFRAAKGVLLPGGVLAVNYIGAPGGRAFACVHATIASVFRHVLAIGGEEGGDVQTITVFASDREIEFNRGWMDVVGTGGVDPVSATIERLRIKPSRSDAFVLTDDYNPVDFLRGDEALRWRARTIRNIGGGAVF
ncbi:MAG: fused MFS/spermidine synthase [Planctomycetota bacterium]|nr:fused MFS/spermidine synthase [Planctomycetota bacterium]